MSGLCVVKVLIVGGGAIDLQNFRAQVAHINTTRNRVGAIHRILIHNVGIAGFKLNFCQCLEKVAGVNVLFAHALVGDQFVVLFAYGDIAEGFTVKTLDVIR